MRPLFFIAMICVLFYTSTFCSEDEPEIRFSTHEYKEIEYTQWVSIDLSKTFPMLAPYLHDSGEYHKYNLRTLLECAVNERVFEKDPLYKHVCRTFLDQSHFLDAKNWDFYYHIENILDHEEHPIDIPTRVQIARTVLKFVNDLKAEKN